jgi:hypothetical protein
MTVVLFEPLVSRCNDSITVIAVNESNPDVGSSAQSTRILILNLKLAYLQKIFNIKQKKPVGFDKI